jgi:hypothetical protein
MEARMTLALLSANEERRYIANKETIRRGLNTFVEVGTALLEVRDTRQYRAEYATFEDFCRQEFGMSRPNAYRLIEAAKTVSYLSPMGDVLPESERVVRPLTSLPAEEQPIVWQAAVDTAPNGKVTAAHVATMVEEHKNGGPKMSMEVHYSSESPEWYTPPHIVSCVLATFGAIDLDPCSNSLTAPVIPAAAYYTTAENGLAQPWRGRVYMNPPYGRVIAEWVAKLLSEYLAGNVTEAVALVPARTDTEWFRCMKAYPRCFVAGRLNFSGAENSAPVPSAVIYLGPNIARFVQAFGSVGDTYVLQEA